MSATMIMTTPPPTNNSLDKEERARLLRSTRKLGAVLGTTPLLVEVEAQPARSQKDKIRREGRLFSHSTASSISSMASFATASSATVVSHTRPSMESDYVFVRRNGRSAPYQVQAVFDNASPASSRSASPMPGVGTSVTQTSQSQGSSTPAVTRKRKWSRNEKWIDANGGATPGQVPRDVLFSGTSGSAFTSSASGSGSKQTRSSAKGKDTGSATSSHLPHPTQPLLLRPRAGPESEPTDSDINFTSVMGDSDSISLFTVSQPQPLSPTSSTFNMSLLTVDPFLPSSSSKALSDREKRRKLAKLARTLGENILFSS
ncbi:hypothetical protein CPC08DRAFT_466829 [Agrocybe pediades]|nr:hypothetical protein CPC08DRAFT_466829 [Agrocybe pediades]